ncbi:cyclin-T1.1 [Ditylenchus destructor]|nr:cyclin-T1.1 [Ditylenchus destructor]
MNSVPNSNSTPAKVGNSVPGAVPNSQSHISQPSYSGTNPYDIPPTWCFSKEELEEMPSLKEGMTQESEQQMRQQAAVFIQDMAEKLNSNVKDTRGKITRNCMCVAMVHLHRFFVIHSMKMFDPRDVAAACLFLAGKGEECPRKLDHIVNVWFRLKNKIDRPFVLEAKVAQQESEYIVLLESIVLQTIGFILQVELPHPLILTAMTNLAKSSPSSRSLMETAYYFATDILLITDWCIRYTMRTLACVCIQLTCIWAEFKIPPAASNFKPWYQTVDPDLSEELFSIRTIRPSSNRPIHRNLCQL